MTTDTATRTVPLLRPGDRLTRPEFEARYAAMPPGTRAELIEGVVYIMPSPVSSREHGKPHFLLGGWLFHYQIATPGVEGAHDATLRLDLDNEPQPDVYLRILPECGGQSRTTEDGYVEGAPELVCEVSASSASYDLHDKLNAYRRNGVREYLVWRVLDRAIDWFVAREGRFQRLEPTPQGMCSSEVFPGLWLDPSALVAGDAPKLIRVLEAGLASEDHARFVTRLRRQ